MSITKSTLLPALHSCGILLILGSLSLPLRALEADRERASRETAALRKKLAEVEAENEKLKQERQALLETIRVLDARLKDSDAHDTLKKEAVTEQKPKVRWENQLALGASLTAGNTDSRSLNLEATSNRKTDFDRLGLRFNADYGETDGKRSQERISGSAQYDHKWSDDAYWYGRLAGEHDSLRKLDFRINAGPGIGYRIFHNDHVTLSLETGPNVQWEQAEQNREVSFQMRGAQNFEWRITRDFRLFQLAEISLDPSEVEDRNARIEAGLETRLTEKLALRLVGSDRFRNIVPADRSRHDFSLTSSVVWNF